MIKRISDYWATISFSNNESVLFALRVTLSTSLLILSYKYIFPNAPYLIDMAIGSLCVALGDYPNYAEKRWIILLEYTFSVSILSALSIAILPFGSIYFFFLLVLSFSLIYNGIRGSRSINLASSTLLAIVIYQDEIRSIEQIAPIFSGLLLGGLYYTLISFLLWRLSPVKSVILLASKTMNDIANFLDQKSQVFIGGTDSFSNNKDVLNQYQAIVNSIDELRVRIIKSRKSLDGYSIRERRLLVLIKAITDIFESTNAAIYESGEFSYSELYQKRYFKLCHLLSDYMRELSFHLANLKNNYSPNSSYRRESELMKDDIVKDFSDDKISLEEHLNVVINLDSIYQEIKNIEEAFTRFSDKTDFLLKDLDYKEFVSYEDDWKAKILSNLSLNSSQFRFAVRFSITLSASWFVSYYYHVEQGYWIALTVLVLMRSSFIITQSRIWQRIGGTVIGGIFTFLLLTLHPSQALISIIFVLCGFLCMFYIRDKYFYGVFFLTPFILLLFSFFDPDPIRLTLLRILNTVIGSMLVMIANLLILPNWESKSIYQSLATAIEKNCQYLRSVIENNPTEEKGNTRIKLSRKNSQIALANLNNNFQSMIKESSQSDYPIYHIYDLLILLFRSQNLTSSIRLDKEKNQSLSNQDIQTTNEIIRNYSESRLTIVYPNASEVSTEQCNSLVLNTTKSSDSLKPYLKKLHSNASTIYTTSKLIEDFKSEKRL